MTGMLGLTHAAESLSVIPDSAEALGIVGGRFANLQDASALRVSPANIADADRPELLVNAALWHGDIKFNSAATGATIKNEAPWVIPASLYMVLPIQPGRLSFGLGISTPYGLGSEFSKTSILRYFVPYESSLITMNITPAIAWKINDQWSIGAGLEIMRGRLELNQLFFRGVGVPDGELKFGADGWGVGGYMGVTWNLTPHQRLALVGRLPIKVSMDGSFEAQGVPGGGPPGTAAQSDFETDMTFPGSLALGYGIDVTERLTLGFDFKWSANSSHDDIPLRTSNSAALLPAPSIALNWRNSIDLGMGATYKINPVWLARAGYLFSENSMPDSTYTPAIANNDRHVFSMGMGWQGKNNSVDLTYAFVFNPGRTVTGANTAVLNGRYKHQWHVLSLSITHRF